MSPKSDDRLSVSAQPTLSKMADSSPNGATLRHHVHQQQGPATLLVEGMREDGTIIKTDNSSLFSCLSFMYAVDDVEGLIQHDRDRKHRHAQWQEKIRTETEVLGEEAEEYGDLLFVKGVDVYRSLPSKLLQCHEWFSSHFRANHVLKTDDDTFINLEAVRALLAFRPLHGRQWWGNFRLEWAVERVGKWREEDYAPSVYPSFACGSGYIVSREVHLWLAANQQFLHPFQGEDVSLGIWLAALAPTCLQDSRWQCFKVCQDDMLSMPDLMPAELRAVWHQALNCTSPCTSC